MRGVCFAVTNLFSKWRFCFWCKGFVFVVTNLFLFSIWGVCFCCGGFTFVVRDFIYVNDWFLMCRNLLPLCRIWFSWKGFICFWCRFCFSCGGLVFSVRDLIIRFSCEEFVFIVIILFVLWRILFQMWPICFKMTILFLMQGICFCWANFF